MHRKSRNETIYFAFFFLFNFKSNFLTEKPIRKGYDLQHVPVVQYRTWTKLCEPFTEAYITVLIFSNSANNKTRGNGLIDWLLTFLVTNLFCYFSLWYFHFLQAFQCVDSNKAILTQIKMFSTEWHLWSLPVSERAA
jgi:hypothetical protein